ncbi:MAG: hypothetical protein ACLQT7_06590 [Candidatus Dormibacteria bacterium]
MPAPADGAVAICLESGSRLSFASALDWPGWSRSGRGEEAAIERLGDYWHRYAPVVRAAGLGPPDPARIEVVERLSGSPAIDFGVPHGLSRRDREPLAAAEAERLVAILDAAWAHFDGIAAGAPASLRKGPRGGGRDRDAIVEHVVGSEVEAYARKLGLHLPRPAPGDPAGREPQRIAIAAALRGAAGAHPAVEDPPHRWPPRYAARRIAWHVLDHAWEIEDRSDPVASA